MSDYIIIKGLAKEYAENVSIEKHPRSIGLFPIPEYPELEPKRGMWSAALQVIFTTLRYLAPATLLTLFWGQQSFLFKLLKHIDSTFRAIVFSSEEQKQDVLRWLGEAGPVRVEHLETVWRHGWIVCGVLDAALPGACAGHPPTRLSLKHAQSIADHYLGVEPVFSRQELESNDSLSKHQEWKLATFLDRIRQALAKLTPPVSKPCSQRTSPETTQFTLDYVARGAGLAAAQVNNKAFFKIYPTAQQSLDPGEITILIRGPKDTYGMTVLHPIFGKAQLIRQKLLGLKTKKNYTENVLPITQGATYLRSYGKNDMNKTYHIPKTKYDIDIEAEQRADHTKVSYKVALEGKYDISITSRGQGIVGSPFTATASKNIFRTLERESFCLEDGEEIDIVDIKTDRKVVLRIVDFVTEKMLLKENGTLEKITNDEANILMNADNTDEPYDSLNEKLITEKLLKDNIEFDSLKFNKIANRVILMNRVCNIFKDIVDKNSTKMKDKTQIRNQGIPDIINSTFTETNTNPFIMSDMRNKYIIPENITVSLITEKSCQKQVCKSNMNSTPEKSKSFEDDASYLGSTLTTYENEDNDILLVISDSPSNPFINNAYDDIYSPGKELGTYVNTEYETNNSQNEETPDSPIKILVEDDFDTTETLNKNPFIDCDIASLERPKTPVYKIITGDIKNRDDSVYVDSNVEHLNDVMLANEFINPFFIHKHHQASQSEESVPITDFIIGAPVSLPPLLRAASPIPNMESLIITNVDTNMENNTTTSQGCEIKESDESNSVFSTPLHTNMIIASESKISSTFQSLDSNMTEDVEIISVSDNQHEYCKIEVQQNLGNVTPKKDIWDSAYVSIDESNSSPDSNNNDNIQLTETLCKQKNSPSNNTFGIKREELDNIGPAERELWETCNELNHVFKISEDSKYSKWEVKRPIFTPIIEENDRSISTGMKDISRYETSESKFSETDPVTVAFAELNDLYNDNFLNSETESTTTINEDNKLHSLEVDFTLKANNCVDSASDIITDVKRQTNKIEGKISEVQANATESVSASQTLHSHENSLATDCNIQFGDRSRSNIVHERKKYWDDRIKEIEAKSLETTTLQKKKKMSSKCWRQNDSLTKRRGKQIVKNFLSTGDIDQKSPANNIDTENITRQVLSSTQGSTNEAISNVKLVDKWKKYWDDKLEMETNDIEINTINMKSMQNIGHAGSPQYISDTSDIESLDDSQTDFTLKSIPVKQELPEEVYKAFETSPKRFFGTSRKQILSKIDTFLGKPNIDEKSPTDVTGACHDSGLVSSRISLFHSMEESPLVQLKSKSMYNISMRNNSIKESFEENIVEEVTQNKSENKPEDDDRKDHVDFEKIPIKTIQEKRNIIAHDIFNKSFDETVYQNLNHSPTEKKNENYVRKTAKCFNKEDQNIQKYKNTNDLRRKSFSRSEMDIFNKVASKESCDDFDKYKSCDELPKINVKNFISLYETVSKTSVPAEFVGKVKRLTSGPHYNLSNNSHIETLNRSSSVQTTIKHKEAESETLSLPSKRNWVNKSFESISSSGTDTKTNTDSIDIDIVESQDKETTFLSLSDIELEIVENNSKQCSMESSPEREIETVKKDYKSRFKMAKEYFQSLEELRETTKPRKLNECELLLENKSAESTESQEKRPARRVKRNIKSHSMPSSEISKIWTQLQSNTENDASSTKLAKISEKFNVDDLFTDVTEGKLSRQGSLRGIPHKKAVLEAFRSMENLTDKKICPYDIALSQNSEFGQEREIKKAQTYLNEYPYLPTTDPSKYQSRVDARASGLITLKELKDKIPRRNSVPDLRLNPTFTVNL